MIDWKALVRTICVVVACATFFIGCQEKQIDIRYAGWENVTLGATGFGAIKTEWSIAARVQAVQEAKVDAYTQLESQALRLKTDTGRKVSELLEKDEALRDKIKAFVRGAKIIRTENAEAGVNITMELFLGDSFKSTLGLSQKRPRSPSSLQNGEDLSP